VVDSSGWIEVFTNGPLADRFLSVIEAEANLVLPAISILATTRAHQARLYTRDADSWISTTLNSCSARDCCDPNAPEDDGLGLLLSPSDPAGTLH
jgi:hypothetical protein